MVLAGVQSDQDRTESERVCLKTAQAQQRQLKRSPKMFNSHIIF